MKILSCESYRNPAEHSPEVVEIATEVLRNGGIVAHPTDTCYGLAVDVMNESAIKKLYDAKGMAMDKPVSILVDSLEEAQKYGEFSDLALRLADEFWPGPLTLVVPRKESLPSFFNPGSKTVGIRVINEPILVAVLGSFGGPVTTTSANKTGEETPYNVGQILVEADLLIDAGWLRKHEKPSTIIQVEDEKATTIRQGDLFDRYMRAM